MILMVLVASIRNAHHTDGRNCGACTTCTRFGSTSSYIYCINPEISYHRGYIWDATSDVLFRWSIYIHFRTHMYLTCFSEVYPMIMWHFMWINELETLTAGYCSCIRQQKEVIRAGSNKRILLPFWSNLRRAISISNYMRFKGKVNLAKLPVCVSCAQWCLWRNVCVEILKKL